MKLNRLWIAGMIMMPIVILIDRFAVTIPDEAVIILYAAAVILMIAGILQARREKEKHIQK